MMNRIKKAVFIVVLSGICSEGLAQKFAHPGLLSNTGDFVRIKASIAGNQPEIKGGFELLKQQPQSQADYKMLGPMAMIGRNPTVGQTVYDSDANAAYQNALMWAITGDIGHAQKAIEIINAWSRTLKSITGRDAVLMAGLGPFKMVNAAEILRYTPSGWNAQDIQLTQRHFLEVIYPVLRNYAPFANGNWDSAALKTVMAIAIFCDDQQMFDNALNYYQQGFGDGRLTNYIINETGQCQESGRDQSHTQLGIAHLADCCEMAWHQGIDLYGLADNRLLKGFEYTAKYNLGYEVPFTPTIDRTGKYTHTQIATEARGRLRAVYEEVFNHYTGRKGIAAPYTSQAAAHLRPEGAATPGADHIGFGTLLFHGEKPDLKNQAFPDRPYGITLSNIPTGILISWPKVIDADSYLVKRATNVNGPFTVLQANIKANYFGDHTAAKGKLYYYMVSAANTHGQSAPSIPHGISNGLPLAWRVLDIEDKNAVNNQPEKLFSTGTRQGAVANYGDTLAITGRGTGIDSIAGNYTLFYKQVYKPRAISMRFIPQFSAQSTLLGVTIQQAANTNAPAVSMILRPVVTENKEAPVWQLQLIKRDIGSKRNVVCSAITLDEPFVTFGRMTGQLWFQLKLAGAKAYASYSADGINWLPLGNTPIQFGEKTIAGVIAASGSGLIDTQLAVDKLRVE